MESNTGLNVSRRTLIKGASAGAVGVALSGMLLDDMFEKAEPAFAAEANQETAEETVVQSHCSCNCASRCPLWMHVKDPVRNEGLGQRRNQPSARMLAWSFGTSLDQRSRSLEVPHEARGQAWRGQVRAHHLGRSH